MPDSGGTFTRTDGTYSGANVFAQEAANGTDIEAVNLDFESQDMATALNNRIFKDGTDTGPTANMPMNGKKHTGVDVASGALSASEYASGRTAQAGIISDAGDTAGTSTAYTATLAPAPIAYVDKALYRAKFNATCGATPTINFNSLGAKKIYWLNSSGSTTQITTNDILASFVALLRYDAALDAAAGAFWLLNLPANLVLGNGTLPRSYLAGLGLANNAGDATNDIDIAAGAARDSTNAADLVLASALTKRLDAAWAVGTNQGGLDTGSIANGTYHLWLIKRPDTGVVDALYSTSASAPTMPANYTLKRYIGSILRESAALVAFTQYGDQFLRNTPLLDITAATPGSSAVTRTLLVPVGVVVEAMFDVSLSGVTNEGIYFSALTQADLAASATVAPLTQIDAVLGVGGTNAGWYRCMTNTAAQIRSRMVSGAAGTLYMSSTGWINRRGRDD